MKVCTASMKTAPQTPALAIPDKPVHPSLHCCAAASSNCRYGNHTIPATYPEKSGRQPLSVKKNPYFLSDF